MNTPPDVSPLAPDLHPLDAFYTRAGLPLPRIEFIAGHEVPEPHKTLLVHNLDMTPTLEEFYGCDIHLEILRCEERDQFYYREVVLRLDFDELPVEFGANKISINLFPPDVRRLILENRIPLGHLLKVFRVPHTSRPQGFLRVAADERMCRAFRLEKPACLYGRRNTIRDPQGRPLSEVVEILPPSVEYYENE